MVYGAGTQSVVTGYLVCVCVYFKVVHNNKATCVL